MNPLPIQAGEKGKGRGRGQDDHLILVCQGCPTSPHWEPHIPGNTPDLGRPRWLVTLGWVGEGEGIFPSVSSETCSPVGLPSSRGATGPQAPSPSGPGHRSQVAHRLPLRLMSLCQSHLPSEPRVPGPWMSDADPVLSTQ